MINFREMIIKRNNNFYLDNIDYQVLDMLYKVVIKVDSLNIYYSFYNLSLDLLEVKKDFISLLDYFQDDITDEILEEYLYILESTKLIKIVDSTITLYPPYTQKEFFESNLLSIFKNNTSISAYKYLSNRFYGSIIEKNFEPISLKQLSKTLTYKIRKNDRIDFSFEAFKKSAKDSDILINDEDINFYNSLSLIYNLKLSDMLAILYEVEKDGVIDKDELIEKANNKHKLLKEKENRLKGYNKTDDEKIEYFNKTKAEEILKNCTLSVADSSAIDRLRNEKHMSEGLLSLLISYSLATNKNTLHKYSFFNKIADDWKEKNITTVKDALLYIDSLYKNNYPPKTKSTKVSTEDWFDDYWDKIKKEKEDAGN